MTIVGQDGVCGSVALSPAAECIAVSKLQHIIDDTKKRGYSLCLSVVCACTLCLHYVERALNLLLDGNQLEVSLYNRGEADEFTHVRKINVTTSLIALFPLVDLNESWPNAPDTLAFSPCGRFISILSPHQQNGMSTPHEALLMIDRERKLRNMSFLPTTNQAPLAFQWTYDGIWLHTIKYREGDTALTGTTFLHFTSSC
mgnify:CR=1 FL=1